MEKSAKFYSFINTKSFFSAPCVTSLHMPCGVTYCAVVDREVIGESGLDECLCAIF